MSNESEKFAKVGLILEKHEKSPHKLIKILQEVQDEFNYLPQEIMLYVASEIGVPPATVYGAATFYSHFTLEPKGKHIIKVCDGTACHIKKSADILKTIQEVLGLSGSKKTSDDMLFSLETVACLGACGIAPVVVIGEEVHGSMNREKMTELINNIREKEEKNNA